MVDSEAIVDDAKLFCAELRTFTRNGEDRNGRKSGENARRRGSKEGRIQVVREGRP